MKRLVRQRSRMGRRVAAGFLVLGLGCLASTATAGVVIRSDGQAQRVEISGITGEEFARAVSATQPVDFRFTRPELAARRIEGVGVGPDVVEALRRALAQAYNFAAFRDETTRRTVIVVLGEADAATVAAAASRPLPAAPPTVAGTEPRPVAVAVAGSRDGDAPRPAARVDAAAVMTTTPRGRSLDDFRKVREPDVAAVNDAIPSSDDIRREVERHERERVQRAIDVLAAADAPDLREAALRDLLNSGSPQATAALRDLLANQGAGVPIAGPGVSPDQVVARVRMHLDAINYDPSRTDALLATLNSSSAPLLRAAGVQLAADVAAYRARQR